ncbi:MAG: hypothetical protein ABSF44_09470 [Candidatus Bathyarchaeia archaeon]|jgi:hypothetical protein
MSSDELELGVLRNIEAKLDQLLKWTRFASLQQLRDLLIQNLTNDRELLVYELSDGERTTREIARLASIGSIATIVRYWEKWSKLGIVEPSQKRQGRYQHFCSLEEVGISIPPNAVMPTETAVTENEEGT